MATKSLPLLPSRREVYSLSLELRLALWIALNRLQWAGTCCQARILAWISVSSVKNLLPLLLDPNSHIIRKSRLDSQMINDHIEKDLMRWEAILDIPISAKLPDGCSHEWTHSASSTANGPTTCALPKSRINGIMWNKIITVVLNN